LQNQYAHVASFELGIPPFSVMALGGRQRPVTVSVGYCARLGSIFSIRQWTAFAVRAFRAAAPHETRCGCVDFLASA
jgi:hypothetical protein